MTMVHATATANAASWLEVRLVLRCIHCREMRLNRVVQAAVCSGSEGAREAEAVKKAGKRR